MRPYAALRRNQAELMIKLPPAVVECSCSFPEESPSSACKVDTFGSILTLTPALTPTPTRTRSPTSTSGM